MVLIDHQEDIRKGKTEVVPTLHFSLEEPSTMRMQLNDTAGKFKQL